MSAASEYLRLCNVKDAADCPKNETLAEHDRKYHPDGYKDGDVCNKRKTMAGGDGVDNVEGQKIDKGDSSILYNGGSNNEKPYDGMWLTDNKRYAEGFGDVKPFVVRLGKVFDAGNIESDDIEGWISSVEKRLGIDKEELKNNASGYEYPSQIINNGLLNSYLVKNGYDSIRCIEGNGNARSYMVLDSKNISRAGEGEINKRRIGLTPDEDAAYMDVANRIAAAKREGRDADAKDIETARRMVREAAARAMPDTKVVDKDGLPNVVWHGSGDEIFNEFKKGDVGFHFGGWSQAFQRNYMKIDDEGVIRQFHLNIHHPLEIYGDARDWNGNRLAKFFLTDKDIYRNESIFGLEQRGGARHNPFNSAEDMASLRQISEMNNTEESNAAMRDLIMRNGYDGIIYRNEVEGDIMEEDGDSAYIALSPSQIKSADPVTYDDAGNVIPMSKRFNMDNPDIRY